MVMFIDECGFVGHSRTRIGVGRTYSYQVQVLKSTPFGNELHSSRQEAHALERVAEQSAAERSDDSGVL